MMRMMINPFFVGEGIEKGSFKINCIYLFDLFD